MMIGKYISELLHSHEAVLLPSFGTFTTKYQPARFIPEKKIVEAPSRVADFNQASTQGESPLTAHVAEQENMTQEEVLEVFKKLVLDIEHSLEAGKKVELEQVGTFSTGTDGQLVFEPDMAINYMAGASEMDDVPLPPPPKGKKGKKGKKAEPIAPPPPPKELTPEEKEERRRGMPLFMRWILFLILPLLILLLILLLNFSYFFGDQGLFRFIGRSAPVELVEPPAEPATLPPVVEEPEPEELLEPIPGEPVFYVVVGSFRSPHMAEELAESLRRQGAERARVFMNTPANYHRVCYGFYHDLGEAEEVMAALPGHLKDVAWILHN